MFYNLLWIIPVILFLPLVVPVIQYEYEEYKERTKDKK